MEPVFTVVFAAVAALSAFTQQLLNSRDNLLNEKALNRAISKKTKETNAFHVTTATQYHFNEQSKACALNSEKTQETQFSDVLLSKIRQETSLRGLIMQIQSEINTIKTPTLQYTDQIT